MSWYPSSVAPFAGAWIEMSCRESLSVRKTSLPSRERGLKLMLSTATFILRMSLPSRERGLKCALRPRGIRGNRVAPFAGAWIEIGGCAERRCTAAVAPFAGAWIEILADRTQAPARPVAPFAGAWIEITRRCGNSMPSRVAPFAGAWIEIASSGATILPPPSLPSRERGLK